MNAVPAPPPRSVLEFPIRQVRHGASQPQRDLLAVEEPLEIRLRYGSPAARQEANLGLTMRTPGDDLDLVAGFLLGEGLLRSPEDLQHVSHGLDRDGLPDPNVVVAEVAPAVRYDPKAMERAYLTTSACGVCGKANLELLAQRTLPPLPPDGPRISDQALRALPGLLRRAQHVFQVTGGLHAAALFDAEGQLGPLREDVGRHNAVDKLVGGQLRARAAPLSSYGLLVSGRASYEILQKARSAGLPFVAAIGAPSSLAVELAHTFDQTLVGFLRDDGYNIYTHPQRVA